MNLLVKILVTTGSSASIDFGIWHFFVPRAWIWYSYLDSNATELVDAVRAINAFFSLSLVLFGIVNILLIYGDKSNRYSIIVMLAETCISWISFASNSHFDRFAERISLLNTVVPFGYKSGTDMLKMYGDFDRY